MKAPGRIVVVGAGPAGLAAADELTRYGAKVIVLEKLDQVGGLCRTVKRGDCRFDIGPHRFFTKNKEVNALFEEVVAEDLVHVHRLTRILYKNKLFNYPLTPVNALFGVGSADALKILSSYIGSRVGSSSAPPPRTFEEWTVRQFGRRLYEIFFKTYTEKVWGIPCDRIGADWAQQRIKGLSLPVAIRNAVFGGHGKKVKTLVDQFIYPRLGAGQLYEKLADRVTAKGGEVLLNRDVTRILRDGNRIRAIEVSGPSGTEVIEADAFLSSAPLSRTVSMMSPDAPEEVRRACGHLRYRNHIGVDLVLSGEVFPDNWIYIHAREVKMVRVANYKSFSSAMAPAGLTPITVEYFASPGDELWRMGDHELIVLAEEELRRSGMLRSARVESSSVIRNEEAYPVMEMGYHEPVSILKAWLDKMENFSPVGRSGMFKYNNQDHAIATGLLAARTLLGLGKFDPWRVNIDAEYHEEDVEPLPSQ